MNAVGTIVLLLLIIVAAVAFVRLTGGAGVGGPIARPPATRERIIERRPTQQKVGEREVVRPESPDRVVERPQPRVVEREIIRENPDVL